MKNILVTTIAFFAAACAQAANGAKPNVLLIVADDLGYGDIGVHGGKEVPTPNIDKLAASGVRCNSGYVAAPYCSPSRAAMLTGRAPTRFGHEFNPHVGDEDMLGLPLEERTVADDLRGAGYATGLIGKWHQGFSPAHHPQARGFDDYFGFLVGGHNYLLRKDAEAHFGSGHSHDMIYRGTQLQKLDGYTTDLFTDEALSFIDRHSQGPWFLYLSYNAVHTPLEVLSKYESRVPDSIADKDRRGYLSLLIGLDDSIGRLMEHLRAVGQDKETLVFFLSDNGGAGRKPWLAYNTGVNKPLRGDKGQTLEGGIRVPYFVSWPGHLPAGAVYDSPVSGLDILPTATAVAGVKDRENVEGVNLIPYLSGEKKESPHTSLAWRFGPQKALRAGNWKIVDSRDFDSKSQSGWQLFDVVSDIGEMEDLSAKFPEKKTELIAAWEKWDSLNIPPRWHGSSTEDPTAPSPARIKGGK
jgi:arylsulfatase A-like enzyme